MARLAKVKTVSSKTVGSNTLATKTNTSKGINAAIVAIGNAYDLIEASSTKPKAKRYQASMHRAAKLLSQTHTWAQGMRLAEIEMQSQAAFQALCEHAVSKGLVRA